MLRPRWHTSKQRIRHHTPLFCFRRILTSRSSARPSVPTATPVTLATQCFAHNRRWGRLKTKYKNKNSVLRAESERLCFFLLRLTSCWSLNSAAPLCTVEFRSNWTLQGRYYTWRISRHAVQIHRCLDTDKTRKVQPNWNLVFWAYKWGKKTAVFLLLILQQHSVFFLISIYFSRTATAWKEMTL